MHLHVIVLVVVPFVSTVSFRFLFLYIQLVVPDRHLVPTAPFLLIHLNYTCGIALTERISENNL